MFSNPSRKKMTIFLSIMVLAGLFMLQPTKVEAHCNSMEGPVVKAAKKALKEKNVKIVLPYVAKRFEDELTKSFEKTLAVRDDSQEAQKLADRYFFETAVRLHRVGEGAGYKGLKPAGNYGPALESAIKAVKNDSVKDLKKVMAKLVTEAVESRFQQMKKLKAEAQGNSVAAKRKRIKAELAFEIYIHKLHNQMKKDVDLQLFTDNN